MATLLLGNVLFYEAKNQELSMQGVEGQLSVPAIKQYHFIEAHVYTELQAVASLLGVEPALLQQGLTLRTYRSDRGEEVQSQCSAAAVSSHTHSIVCLIYRLHFSQTGLVMRWLRPCIFALLWPSCAALTRC